MQWLLPSALGVAGDVMFETVLFYLQSVIEGPIQLLYCHLDGTLQEKTQEISCQRPLEVTIRMSYQVKTNKLNSLRLPSPHVSILYLKAYHIFLSPRWHVVLTDLQLQHVPLPVEGKASKEFHHTALIAGYHKLRHVTNNSRGKHIQQSEQAGGNTATTVFIMGQAGACWNTSVFDTMLLLQQSFIYNSISDSFWHGPWGRLPSKQVWVHDINWASCVLPLPDFDWSVWVKWHWWALRCSKNWTDFNSKQRDRNNHHNGRLLHWGCWAS